MCGALKNVPKRQGKWVERQDACVYEKMALVRPKEQLENYKL